MSELIPRPPAEPRLYPLAEPAPAGELALGEIAAILRRQRLTLFLCVALVVALVAVYTFVARPVFEATSVLRFEQDQVNLPQLVQMLGNENRISTELELLEGRGAAHAVIDSLGLRAQLDAPRKGRVTQLFPVLQVAATADTGTLLFRTDGDSGYAVWRADAPGKAVWARLGETAQVEGVTLALSRAALGAGEIRLRVVSLNDAVRAFGSALKVSRPARDADLIDIRFRSPDPELASRAANLLAGHLIAKRQDELQRRTGVAVYYLRQQLDTLRIQLHQAEDTLATYRERTGAVDPPEQARTQVGRLTQLEGDRGTLDAERQALGQLLAQIRLEAAASPDGPSPYRKLIAFPTLFRNQATAELLNSLTMVENDRAALLRRRTWLDPEVQMLTDRVDELDRQLQGIAETYLMGLTNQVIALDQVGKKFGSELNTLPGKEVQSDRLDRDAKVLQELYGMVQTRLKEAEITQAMQDPTVRVAESAVAADQPVRPRPALNLALGLVLGGLLGLSVSLARELGDRSVRSRADALHASHLPVLGAVPRAESQLPRGLRRLVGKGRRRRGQIGNGSSVHGDPPLPSFGPPSGRAAGELASRLVLHADTPPGYAESFNQLHANLALAFQDRPIKVLVFTSPLPGEGKTLSAINFALTSASRGARVLLIDADLRCGLVNQVFGCAREPGFSELLAGEARFEDGARGILVTRTISLVMLPTGALVNGSSRVLAVDRLKSTLQALIPRFDMIVIDSPPVNVLADAALLGAASDAVLLVVRAGRTKREALTYAMDQLTAARAPVIGTILNDIDLRHNGYDDDAYRYLAEVEKYHAARG